MKGCTYPKVIKWCAVHSGLNKLYTNSRAGRAYSQSKQKDGLSFKKWIKTNVGSGKLRDHVLLYHLEHGHPEMCDVNDPGETVCPLRVRTCVLCAHRACVCVCWSVRVCTCLDVRVFVLVCVRVCACLRVSACL